MTGLYIIFGGMALFGAIVLAARLAGTAQTAPDAAARRALKRPTASQARGASALRSSSA